MFATTMMGQIYIIPMVVISILCHNPSDQFTRSQVEFTPFSYSCIIIRMFPGVSSLPTQEIAIAFVSIHATHRLHYNLLILKCRVHTILIVN